VQVLQAVGRRGLLRLGGLAAASAVLAGCGSADSGTAGCEPAEEAADEHAAEGAEEEAAHKPLTADQALERLRYGNRRFAAGNAKHPKQGSARRRELVSGQHPIAAVLSCVDSRVPPELVFDEGLGGLFVIRTAGQTLDHAVLGSLQFGVHELHIPLLVVLGHSSCGAVKATVETVESRSAATGTDVDALVAAIRPAVERAKARNPDDLVAAAIRENITGGVRALAAAEVLTGAVRERKLRIVGSQYDLASGKVVFYS
jgi:carbonic anhydrase